MPTLADDVLEIISERDTLKQALKEVRALAAGEQSNPTGLHMTCLSLIEKCANRALSE